ncbi:MAG: hypothetical protein ACYSN8_03035, partial [Planctomycetota bacterium]
MNTTVIFRYSSSGKVVYITPEETLQEFGKDKTNILDATLASTIELIKEDSGSFFKSLVNRQIQLRITDSFSGTASLLPHDILLNAALFSTDKRLVIRRQRMIVGILERAFYHLCNPEFHITQVRLQSLHFHQKHPEILKATIQETSSHSPKFDEPDWLESLQQVDNLLLLEHFWTELGKTPTAQALLQATQGRKTRVHAKIKVSLTDFSKSLQKNKFSSTLKFLIGFKWVFTEAGSVILVYKLPNNLFKVVRLCDRETIDAMSTEAACQSFVFGTVRTDIFHAHGQWIRPWIQKLQTYAKDPSLRTLEGTLLSDDLNKVKNAIGQLGRKIRRKENPEQSLRLLYSALYYWNHPDKG